METQLIIVNNGLKDLRGHYFETSVAIAGAAREAGLRPVLGAHHTCPTDLAPPWLELHPVFTTDHWMGGGLPPPLDWGGVRSRRADWRAVPAERLLNGTATFLEYLNARFEPLPAANVPQVARGGRLAALKGFGRALVPPLLHPLLRRLSHARQWLAPLVRRGARQLLPPALHDRLRRCCRGAPRGQASSPEAPADSFLAALQTYHLQHELDYARRFREDLERFITLLGCGPGDHVFFPTAHGRELLAVLWMLNEMPEDEAPTFHLEFRHDVLLTVHWNGKDWPHPYSTFHRLAFGMARAYPPHDRVLLYTDTEELAEEYHDVSGLEFGVLPIPFRSGLIDPPPREEGPLHIAYLGDVREEKGFAWLPELVDSLMEDYVRPGRARFLIQASLIHPEAEPRCREALELLKGYRTSQVELVGVGRPLSPEEYYRTVARADLLLCPYDAKIYRSRSSGTLAEGIAAGIPTVVPRGGWLGRQQPPGTGETFDDLPSFLDAVRRVLDDYPRYRQAAAAKAAGWLAAHTPANLVRALVTDGGCWREGRSRLAG